MTDWSYYRRQTPFCEVCGAPATDTHHIRARGRKGTEDNRPTNLISLCHAHHMECHSLGRKRFPAKYGLEARWARAFEPQGELT